MATVVNTTSDRSSSTGWILSMLLLLFALFLFFYYGLPALRGATNYGGATINVPEQVDVNVNQPAAPAQ